MYFIHEKYEHNYVLDIFYSGKNMNITMFSIYFIQEKYEYNCVLYYWMIKCNAVYAWQ